MNRPLWTCPQCGRTFANRNQSHTCAPLGDVDRLFARSEPAVRAAYERVVALALAAGPLQVLPQKTRIALHARMSFAAFTPRRRWLDGHLVLAREAAHPRIRRVDAFSPGNVLHAFRLDGPDDVDAAFARLVAESYEVGVQRRRRA